MLPLCPSLFPLVPSPVHSSNSVPVHVPLHRFSCPPFPSARPFFFYPLVWPPVHSHMWASISQFMQPSIPSVDRPTTPIPPLCGSRLLHLPAVGFSSSVPSIRHHAPTLSLYLPPFSYTFFLPLVPLCTHFQRFHPDFLFYPLPSVHSNLAI